MASGLKNEPWHKQKGETACAYRYFTLYKDMHGRSISRLAKLLGRSARGLEKYSSNYNWKERAAAWDRELDNRLLDKRSDDIEAMRQRHVQLGLGMQTAVAKELKAWVHKVELANAKAKAKGLEHHDPVLSVNELIRISEHGINLERISRGEPTGHVKVNEEVDLSALSVEELKQFRKLKKKMSS